MYFSIKTRRDTLEVSLTMVKPILIYASDFRDYHKLPVNNLIDRLFNSVCRQMLGVQKNTSTIGVLLEVGRVPTEPGKPGKTL